MPDQSKDYDKFIKDAEKYHGRVFSVTFKRENDKREKGVIVARRGELRTMRCRLGVAKDVKGVYKNRMEEDRANGVITVYEMNGWKSGYKRIKIANIVSMSEAPEEKE